MGQELHSCDTTQIDVLETSARFTRHHACPMDNGWVPVGIYLVSRSSRPRKSIHLAAPRPDLTTQDSLIRLSAALPPEHKSIHKPHRAR